MRINSHTHVFNLKSVLSDESLGIIQDRLRRDIAPEWLGKAAGSLAGDLLGELADYDEAKLLRKLAKRIEEESGLADLLKTGQSLPAPLRSLLESQAESLTLTVARRGAAALLGLAGRKGDDVSRTSVRHVLDTLRLVARSRIADVAESMFSEMADEDAAVLLSLDITRGDGAAELFAKQIEDTAALAFAYPGRAFPFYGLDPRRSQPLARLRKAVEESTYVGVKIYPSTGWKVGDPRMAEVYDYCHQQDLPILMHCNDVGFYSDKADTANADPGHWLPILQRLPRLKVCFAHFGGGSGLVKPAIPPAHWARKILSLMESFGGVYADLSSHSAPMKDAASTKSYFTNLKALLADARYRDRILFGTDYWLVRFRLTETRHWRYFEENLGPEGFERIAAQNPRRFLGLPEAPGAALGPIHQRFVERLAADPAKLGGPPAAWLLEQVERRLGAARRAAMEAAAERLLPARSLRIRGFRQFLEEQVATALLPEKAQELGTGTVDLLGTSYNGASIALSGEGSIKLERFADDDHQDADGVLGLRRPPPANGPLVLQPAIAYRPERQWLKLRLAGKLRVQGSGSLGSVGLSLEADKEALFVDYRCHPADAPVLDALRQDLRRPRFALSRRDVLSLGAEDALTYATRGSLKLGATLTLADAFSTGIAELARVAGLAGPVGVKVSWSVTASLSVTLTDDFQVVFARRRGDAPDRLYLAVRKLDARGVSFSLSAGASLQWADEKAVRAALGQLVQARLGKSLQQVDALLAKSAAALTQADRSTLADLAQKLGAAGLDKVRERYEGLLAKLRETLDRIATAKVEAGFRYEYSRLTTTTTLLEARVAEETVADLHDQLVDGDLAGLLDRDASEVEIERYLVELRKVVERSWGFTLGSRIAGRDREHKEIVEQIGRDASGEHRKVSFLGRRSYDGTWHVGSATSWKWQGELKADMQGFSAGARPVLRELDFGLAFLFQWTESKLSQAKLKAYLDAAALWSVTDDDIPGLQAAFDRFNPDLEKKDVTIDLELKLDHHALMRILPEAAANNADNRRRMGEALAAAMPYVDDAIRKSPATRRRAYGPLWEEILAKGGSGQLDAGDFAVKAEARLRNEFNNNAAATKEHNQGGVWRSQPWTLGGMLTINPTPADRFVKLLDGLEIVAGAEAQLAASPDFHAVQDVHASLEPFFRQAHWTRALGAYLLGWARDKGALDHVVASCVVTVEGNALVIGRQ